MKAVIPAAGLGTRFLPYTRSQPKEMLPVVDKPAIQYVVEEAVDSGIQEILVVTARGKRAIEDHFDRNIELEHHFPGGVSESSRGIEKLLDKARIFYVRQTEHRGLGHAVLIAEKFVGEEPIAVLLGDDLTFGSVPCLKSLIDIHERTGASVLAVQRVRPSSIGKYGMVVGEMLSDGVLHVEAIVEKPSPEEATSDLATIGRYVLTPAIFRHLRDARPGKNGEIQLTDAISSLLQEEEVYALVFDGRRYDIGDKIGWLQANVELAMTRPDLREDLGLWLEEYLHRQRG